MASSKSTACEGHDGDLTASKDAVDNNDDATCGGHDGDLAASKDVVDNSNDVVPNVHSNKGKRKARTRRAFTDHPAQGATEKTASAFDTMMANLLAPPKLLKDGPRTMLTAKRPHLWKGKETELRMPMKRRMPDVDRAVKWAYLDDVYNRDDQRNGWVRLALHETGSDDSDSDDDDL